MTQKLKTHLTVKVHSEHIKILNQAAGSGKVNYSAFVRHAIEQTYGDKKMG